MSLDLLVGELKDEVYKVRQEWVELKTELRRAYLLLDTESKCKEELKTKFTIMDTFLRNKFGYEYVQYWEKK